MPIIANTPESLVARVDSLDPATTCRGLTGGGRPCRRQLASASDSSSSGSPAKLPSDPAAQYCWQHQDQATQPSQQATPAADPSKPRTSIDTLMERLGVMDLNGGADHKKRRRRTSYFNKKPKSRTLCCCFTILEDDEPLPNRPARPSSQQTSAPPQMQQVSRPPKLTASSSPSSWIPPALSQETTSTLLAELEKPISDADEPGYIYMFWVTPDSESSRGPPPSDVASSLFPPSSGGQGHPRSINDALQTARELKTLATNPTDTSPGTLRLKIGRTNNVQRRLNEWSRQCSHSLTLIRYYPYTPSTPQPSPSRHRGSSPGSNAALDPGRKVPHVHRVEHLIHIELADIKARDMGKCPDCGKQHQEWFEVSAEKAALKRVDDCIRRWVHWAECH